MRMKLFWPVRAAIPLTDTPKKYTWSLCSSKSTARCRPSWSAREAVPSTTFRNSCSTTAGRDGPEGRCSSADFAMLS